ncbi:hypothetical protein EDD11_008871 [Mortierella claussenii]|nr:hypothetical protein EDD11_008871 [Mortierella claussenii]
MDPSFPFDLFGAKPSNCSLNSSTVAGSVTTMNLLNFDQLLNAQVHRMSTLLDEPVSATPSTVTDAYSESSACSSSRTGIDLSDTLSIQSFHGLQTELPENGFNIDILVGTLHSSAGVSNPSVRLPPQNSSTTLISPTDLPLSPSLQQFLSSGTGVSPPISIQDLLRQPE